MTWRGRLLLLPPALVGLYLLAAVAGALWPNDRTGGGDGPVNVWLLSGPIHYDFLLPADPATVAAFGFAERAGVPLSDPRVEWIVVGWGARAFYTATESYADLGAATVWRAVSGDEAVLHVSVAGALGDGSGARPLRLTAAEYGRLRDAILASAPAPDPVPDAGFGPYDRFFAATGRFHLFRTCNVWVAEVLDRAGIRFGLWTPTPFAVTLSLARFQAD
ncbi:MAG: TIGR02117 family protein [Sagittula sp.]|uniref:TIGR02117 family protein n=1 Tax=Sagittula sp. TaxID=2038081 RepID=UPI00405A361F